LSPKTRERYRIDKEIDIKLLKHLISFLDGYLANYFDDPEPIENKIKGGKLGREISREWRDIEKSLKKMALTVRRIPKVSLYVKLTSIMRGLSLVFLVIASGTAFTLATSMQSQMILYLFATSLSISSLSAVYSMIYNRKMNMEIERYFNEHREKYQFIRGRIKNIVQKLINTYSYYIMENKLDPSKNKLSLYNINYSGIKIVKKPRLLNKKYEVIVKI